MAGGGVQVSDDDDVDETVLMEMESGRKYSFCSYFEVRINAILIVRLW